MKRFVFVALVGPVFPLALFPIAVWAQSPEDAAFRVNTYTSGGHSAPTIAAASNGGFVVVWESGQAGSGNDVFARRFGGSGSPLGAEFQVNQFTTDNQGRPSVAVDSDGNFVVAWHSYGQDGSHYGIVARRFDSSGNALGPDLEVNTYTTGVQVYPAVASSANGSFVVVWRGVAGQDGSSYGVVGRRFDSSGTPIGSEFQVNSYTTGYQGGLPSIASDSAGNFVVVWNGGGGQDGSDEGVFGQRFDTAGNPVGAEFQVNAYTTAGQVNARVASAPSGDFVVVWAGATVGDYSGIAARRFNAAGVPQGSEFRVNASTTGYQNRPSVALDPDGGFVVVWHGYRSDGSGFDTFGQMYDAGGNPKGVEFRVNAYTTGHQESPVVAVEPNTNFIVAWTSNGQECGSDCIFAQRFTDIIFKDGFESGSMAAWSGSATDLADLSVSGAAALASTHAGLLAFVNDTNSLYVQDDTPNAESRYRARFYVDTNGFDPGETQSHFRTRIFIAFDAGNQRVITLVLRRQSGQYSLEGRARLNDGTRADTGFFPISDGPHFIEFDWQRATGPGASDGSLQLWIDGVSVATLTGIDNDLAPVDAARLGALSVKTGAAGALFFDEFVSRRRDYIGAVP